MSNKNPLTLRVPDKIRSDYSDFATRFSVKEGRSVTSADIYRRALEIAQPILEQELQEPMQPGVTVVTQMTRLKEAKAFVYRALEMGLEQMQSQPAAAQ